MNTKETDHVSVADYIAALNSALSGQRAKVLGEVVQYTAHPSGHRYFTIKDVEQDAILSCKMWQSAFRQHGFELEEGMKVICSGVPDIWAKNGRLSLTVNKLELFGEGDFIKAYRLLKEKLEKEGLFDRKRELPEFIEKVGVVSSSGGVVKQDVLTNLAKRGLSLKLYHAAMEGDKAPSEIVAGIDYFNKKAGVDVIVVVRGGGGNFEILQAFNNEAVCRALFASKIPTIAGIGHDVDVPIASLVADHAASTPTGVAHLINSSWDELSERLPMLERDIYEGFSGALRDYHHKIGKLAQAIESRFREIFIAFERMEDRLRSGLARIGQAIASYKETVARAEQLLSLVSPERNLKLGYSIVRGPDGKVMKSVAEVKKGQVISAEVADGTIESEVLNTSKSK